MDLGVGGGARKTVPERSSAASGTVTARFGEHRADGKGRTDVQGWGMSHRPEPFIDLRGFVGPLCGPPQISTA